MEVLFFQMEILFFRRQLSVFELNQLFYSPHQALRQNPILLDKLEKLNSLISQNWHETIHKRLKNTYDISYMDSL